MSVDVTSSSVLLEKVGCYFMECSGNDFFSYLIAWGGMIGVRLFAACYSR